MDRATERDEVAPLGARAAAVPPELGRGFKTAALPAVAGEARVAPEDFVVEELPLYEPCGEGEHLYVTIEKRGVPTPEAIRRLARVLGARDRDAGYAGLKDAKAVARQTLSFQFGDAAKLERFEDPQVKVLSVARHRNKLKPGHLRGNRFTLRLRGTVPEDEARVRATLEHLARTGAPNYFGLQRFGSRRNNHLLGLALVREDARAFLDELLGRPTEADNPRVREGREAYERGEPRAALERFPPAFQAERSALQTLERDPRDPARAVRSIAPKWRQLYVSALQSLLFNAYLTRRLDRIERVEAGEVAILERNGAAFLVEDPEREQARCDARELSPSGPSFGAKLLRPREGSPPRADEDAVLAEHALGAELGPAMGANPRGERRALRVLVGDPAVTAEGGDLLLRFSLPRGCYATTILEELLKRPLD